MQQPLTVEDFYAMPDAERIDELQAGVLISEELPGFRHGLIATNVVAELSSHVRMHKLGVVFGRCGLVLARSADTVRGPEAAFVARERYQRLGGGLGPFPEAPDLAVGILSPTNTQATMHAKVADYLAAGTRRVWVVDSEAQTVSVYETLLSPRILCATDFLEGEDVVPGFRIRVAEIFEI